VTGTVCTLADASNPELFLPGTPEQAISPRVLPHINASSVSTDAPGSLEASSRSEFEPMLNIPALKVD